jgi:DNA-binding beta-propeller fold protein YncE
MRRRFLLLSFLLALGIALHGQSGSPLRLENTIPLPDVQGRIDHMSIDVQGERLFVAALGNNTVEVVDLKQAKRVHSIPGLQEPQGALYLPGLKRLFIANADDGTVRIFDGRTYAEIKTTHLGDDADNVRYDAERHLIYVGYGSGGLAVLSEDGTKNNNIPLDAHPESFQLEKNGSRLFVNLPDSRKIAVIDRIKASVVANWGTSGALSNFPMALDEPNHRLFVICRAPAELLVLDTGTGQIVAKLPAVGDCDDVFYDPALKRIYATGGEGAISVFQQQDKDHYKEVAKIATRKGARTSFFSPDFHRLYVALRRQGSESAAIRAYATQQ